MEQRLPGEPGGWRKLQALAQIERDPEKLATILERMNRLLTAHEKKSLGGDPGRQNPGAAGMLPRSPKSAAARKYHRSRSSDPVTPRQSISRQPQVHTQFGRTSVQIFAANERMNQMLIENLDPAAWTAKPPTAKPGNGRPRTIAAIFTHMHNVRSKWVRLSAPHLKIPRQLNRTRCTPHQARARLAESAARCVEMLAEALGGGEGHIQKFRRDGWARSWPVGMEMLCYMLAHEAHHRGQVCMLAHQLGFPLPSAVSSGLWNWEKLWKECGATGGPGDDMSLE